MSSLRRLDHSLAGHTTSGQVHCHISKDPKRDLKYGKCFLNLFTVEGVWRTLGSGTLQLQEPKLTISHSGNNAFSQVNAALAMQVLLAIVATMVCREITANNVELPS